MDGLSRCLGVGNFIELAGECALMRPVTLGMLAICENHLLALRKTPLDVIQETYQDINASAAKHVQKLVDRAVNEIKRDRSWRLISFDDMHKWLHTQTGIAFTAWLCLRKRHSLAVSPLKLEEWFVTHPDQGHDFVRRRDICSGLDYLASMDFIEPPHPFPEKQRDLPRSKYMPWRKIIHDAAQGIYKMPKDIAKLTLYSLRILTTEADSPTLGGTASVSAEDARKMQRMDPDERRAYIQALHEAKE